MSIRRRSDAVVLAFLIAGNSFFPKREARADEPEVPRAPAPPPEDPELEASRVRFRKGMDAYVAGDFAGAIVTWQGIYAELGKERGYRLAFNLARAYDAYGDVSRASELFSVYLEEVARRRARLGRGETLPPLVEKQAVDAEERVAELVRTRGRLRVPVGKAPVEVRIDGGTPRLAGFSSLLAPGRHVLVFGTGDAEVRREIVLVEGEELVVSPPTPLLTVPAIETSTVRPFSRAWLFVGAGATALSVVVPAVQYARAISLAGDHDTSTDALERERLASEYSGAKAGAYATLAIPIVLGAATLGLGAVYVFGSRTESVRIATRGLGLDATLTY